MRRKIELPNGEWAVLLCGDPQDGFTVVWSHAHVTTGQHSDGLKSLVETIRNGRTHDQCAGFAPAGSETHDYLFPGAKVWKRN